MAGVTCEFPLVLRVVAALLMATVAMADEAVTDLSPPERAIVVSPQTKLMQGDESKNTVPPGQLLTFIKAKGDWRYTPDFRGWVSLRDVVPLEKAVDYFTNVIKKMPSSAAYHHRGIAHAAQLDWESALKDFDEAIGRGESTTFVFVNRGLAHRELGTEEKALEDFTKAIAIDPKNAQAHLLRGMLLQGQGHFESALKDFDVAIELAPKAADPHNQRGLALRGLEQDDEAFAAFNKALELAPKHAEAMANRAFVHCLKGRFTEAVQDYDNALKLQPKNPEFLNDYAWLLSTCRDQSVRDPKRALTMAQEANDILGEPVPEFLDTLAAAQARAGNYEAAIATATKALETMGQDPNAPAKEVHDRLKLYQQKQPYTEEVIPD